MGKTTLDEKNKKTRFTVKTFYIFLFAFKNIFSPASAKLNKKLLTAH